MKNVSVMIKTLNCLSGNKPPTIEKLCYGLRGSAFRKCISIIPIFLDIKELETKLSNYIYALKIDKIAPSIK